MRKLTAILCCAIAILIIGTLYLAQNRETKMALDYVGPYSPEAYNAALIQQQGGVGTPYTAPIIDAGQAILAAQSPAGGSGGTVIDPATGQAISNVQAAINRLSGQQASGNQSIDTSYQDAINQLLGARNTGERNYNQAKQTSATDYVGAKNTIGSQFGQTLSGLLRLLGSRGAGASSAALTSAPQAVARGASLQRADVGNTFGKNQQALDTNWGDYLQGYNNQVASAGSQRDRAKQTLQQSIDTNKASLLQTLAGLQNGGGQNYLDQANQLLDKSANYTVAPINYDTKAYTAPTAASYNPATPSTPQYSGSGTSDYFSPYLQSLLGKKQQVFA